MNRRNLELLFDFDFSLIIICIFTKFPNQKAVNEDNEVMLITTEGIIIRIQCSDISILGRITSGVKLINLSEGVTVAGLAKVRDKEEQDTKEEWKGEIK